MVLVAFITTLVLSALGLGLVTVTNTETTIAANYRETNDMLYAADAAAELASAEVIRASSWNDVLNGAVQSVHQDGTLSPHLMSGGVVSLTTMTAALQAASDADAKRGLNNPRWRLFLYQPLGSITRTVSREYVVAWVADDLAETDNDPLTDSNGLVVIRAQAIGRLGLQRTIDVTIAKQDLGIGITSWREVR